MSQSFTACEPNATQNFVDVIVGENNLKPDVIASLGIVGAIIALVACLYFTRAVLKESVGIHGEHGEERARGVEMERIRKMIFDGARTYLNTQCAPGLGNAHRAACLRSPTDLSHPRP